MSRDTSIPLVRCRACSSPLLQPVDVVAPLGGLVILMRRCPECEHQDTVVAEDVAVQTWLRRDARVAAWMLAVANHLAADELPSAAGP